MRVSAADDMLSRLYDEGLICGVGTSVNTDSGMDVTKIYCRAWDGSEEVVLHELAKFGQVEMVRRDSLTFGLVCTL